MELNGFTTTAFLIIGCVAWVFAQIILMYMSLYPSEPLEFRKYSKTIYLTIRGRKYELEPFDITRALTSNVCTRDGRKVTILSVDDDFINVCGYKYPVKVLISEGNGQTYTNHYRENGKVYSFNETHVSDLFFYKEIKHEKKQ